MIGIKGSFALLMFKIDDEFSLGVANRTEDITIEGNKVTYIEEVLEGDKFVQGKKYEAEWIDGKAKWEIDYYSGSEKIALFDKNYLIEEVKEEGDSLLI